MLCLRHGVEGGGLTTPPPHTHTHTHSHLSPLQSDGYGALRTSAPLKSLYTFITHLISSNTKETMQVGTGNIQVSLHIHIRSATRKMNAKRICREQRLRSATQSLLYTRTYQVWMNLHL